MSKLVDMEKSRNQNTMISFIIPTFNEEKYISKTLAAIKELVLIHDYEIILVDNGSTDKTIEIAKKYNVKIYQDTCRKIGGLRNLGAEFAVGKILVFIDGDVILTKNWEHNFTNVTAMLEQNNKVITGSRYGIRANPTWIEKYWFAPMTQEKSNYINGGHLIIDRKIFYEIGGFNDALATSEDWEFCMRAKEKGLTIVNNPHLIVIHEGYPKTLRQFIRRETWHGIQDYHDLHSFFHSRPAMLAMLYWITGISGIMLSLIFKVMFYFEAGIIINCSICMAATLNKRKQFPLNIFYYFLIYHFYFYSRGLSLKERLFSKSKIKRNVL